MRGRQKDKEREGQGEMKWRFLEAAVKSQFDSSISHSPARFLIRQDIWDCS